MTVVTRFAPSPTGYLHIGGARTALFNWLYARHCGGKFYLRIEDTDRERSTKAAVDAIFEGLEWLGIDWDAEPVFQFARAPRHVEVAQQLLKEGKAYYCYCSPEELAQMREEQKAAGKPVRYDGRWRDRDPSEAPKGVKPVIRIKAPREGETVLHDLVQGEVRVSHDQLDDMILVRADGTPTYMLSVVVDDHDMGVNHVIRGDDHLTNTFRQIMLHEALGWDVPTYAHIPLIHGPDGLKLSKRHGALGAHVYKEMGFLPEAMRNYLMKLGWAHGDDEIISTEQAVEWFDIKDVGRSPARFDMVKLTSINGVYIRNSSDEHLMKYVRPIMEKELGAALSEEQVSRVLAGMADLKERAKNLNDLAKSAMFYVRPRPLPLMSDKAGRLISDGKQALEALSAEMRGISEWKHDVLEQTARDYAEKNAVKLGAAAQPLRAAITGSEVSPPIFKIMEILGKEETLARIDDALNGRLVKPEPPAV